MYCVRFKAAYCTCSRASANISELQQCNAMYITLSSTHSFQLLPNVMQNALPLVAAIMYAEIRVLRIDILAVFCNIYVQMYLSSSSNCSVPTNASIILYKCFVTFHTTDRRTIELLHKTSSFVHTEGLPYHTFRKIFSMQPLILSWVVAAVLMSSFACSASF